MQATFSAPALLDLNAVDEPSRPAAWQRCAKDCFPGLSVLDLGPQLPFGVICESSLGSGRLWSILSPPLRVSYDPADADCESTELFSIMLQLAGSTLARQSGRCDELQPGGLCVIDGAYPFELEVTGAHSRFMVLQMPRYAAVGRHPHLERHTAEAFDPAEPGTTVLRNLLLTLLDAFATLACDQRAAAFAAVIQLLGAPRLREPPRARGIDWRVRAALAHIDATLADPDLDASHVAAAQGISRRRLDEIMVSEMGTPVTAQIWLRRLEQAARDLVDPNLEAQTVTQIAFAAGFADAAHFTRAFKRRFGCTPSEWRGRPFPCA